MKLLKSLSKFEWALWLSSLAVVTLSFLLAPQKDWLNLVCSLIGVTSLIFISKGVVTGQVLLVVFSVFYGVISFFFHYYGEMITYLGMSAPIAVAAVVSWLRHPYRDTKVVRVATLTAKKLIILILLSAAVTAVFYFILKALGNANLLFSTISVFTSFFAASLTFLRSPYYGLGYASNDAVLIVLWTMAAFENPSYFPMVVCFAMFLLNDVYGFINWMRLRKSQSEFSNR